MDVNCIDGFLDRRNRGLVLQTSLSRWRGIIMETKFCFSSLTGNQRSRLGITGSKVISKQKYIYEK